MASDLLYSHSFSRYSHLKPFQALIINFKGLHNAVLPSIWCYCIEIRPKAATFGILIYPRIRNGFSVQIKIKREPAISVYFIKVIFIWIWTENVGGAISVLIPIKRESIVKYYNVLLGRHNSERGMDEVTFFYVGDLFCIHLGTKFRHFFQKSPRRFFL